MKRLLSRILRILLVLTAGSAVMLVSFYILYKPAADRFPAHTIVNKTDVSGLTFSEADEKLAESLRKKDFTFVYKGAVYKVPVKSLSFEISSGSVMSSLSFKEKLRFLFRLGNEFEINLKPADSEEFMSEIKALPLCDNKGKVKTTDAYVDLSDFEFRTVKEKTGTEVDPGIIRDIAYSHIENRSFSAELAEDEIIRQPGLKADSKEFKERLDYCKKNLDYRIEYEIDGVSDVITPEILDEMVKYGDGEPEPDKNRIDAFILDLAGKCNEYKNQYSFTTHSGSQISVQAVTFGRVLDKDAMTEALKKALEEQESCRLELVWSQQKYSGGEGIGSSYIETSIKDQHVWLYKNGECIVDCDCVTGAPGHDTVKGVYVVQYVSGPTTLKGDNGDGTRYESPVNCFVPFYNGQGFHGSNGWRSKWGGSIYKTDGSHGCVNCPDAAAKKIADSVCSGYPVVIY